jgi:acyl dehydratase
MLNYHQLKTHEFPDVVQTYTERDTMLYALGLGLGSDPLDGGALRYVYERDLHAMPTMPVVLGSPGFFLKEPLFGIDWVKLVHGEQSVSIHRPLPVAGTVVGKNRVTRVVDKQERGAFVHVERQLMLQESDDLVATLEQVLVLRGDGGFSSSGQPSDESPPATTGSYDGEPTYTCDLPTRPETALIYRLSGDRNPLHADPEVARKAGFDRPILHGLASFGLAAHAILRTCCDYDASRIASIRVRFAAPVFPGETIRTSIWLHDGEVSFRAKALERDRVVLDHGVARLAPSRGN